MSDASLLPFPVPPVVKTVTVRCPPETAFRRFTEGFASWWPLARFHAATDPAVCVFEGRVGGRVFERAGNGAETVWGEVVAWDPPHLAAFTWLVGVDEERAQRVEVTFTSVTGGTEVRLVHSGWEKLGDRAVAQRDAYDKGWVAVFEQGFAAYADRDS
jgi:uncharacterized protein YndB with AHSA1/START domain